jgi:hypothetical protein
MSVFDMISVGMLVLFVGGYFWVAASRKAAPPKD